MTKDKDAEEELTLPQGRTKVAVFGPGDFGKPIKIPEKAAITGKTLKVSFRASRENLRAIDEHLDRMAEQMPGVVFLATDAIRDLLDRGARAFREDEHNEPDNEDQ